MDHPVDKITFFQSVATKLDRSLRHFNLGWKPEHRLEIVSIYFKISFEETRTWQQNLIYGSKLSQKKNIKYHSSS